VLRWEAGERVPDTGAEAGLLAYCREHGLLRTYARGPLAGVTLSPEVLQELLADARWQVGDGRARLTSSPRGHPEASPQSPVADPASSTVRRSRQAPFVGRDREFALLLDRLNAAGLGRLGVMLLKGEPGVGKTRLVLELADHAASAGWRVLIGAAFDSEGAPPYLPFVEALQHYVRACPLDELRQQLGETAADVALVLPEIGRKLPDVPARVPHDADSDRYRLFDSLASFIGAIAQASTSGLLLCLEDLQWADDSTLLLLEHVCRRLSSSRMLILATYRDTDLDARHTLARTLEQLIRRRVSLAIAVERLDRDGVRLMLVGLGKPDPPNALVQAVYSETEGNPFFVHEVFDYLAEEGRLLDAAGAWRSDLRVGPTDVPDSVRLVIGRRLERLSAECRSLLGLAAVLGRTLDYGLLRACSDQSDEALIALLEEAEAARLLMSDDDGALTFGHELIRQTLLAGLTALRRQRLHLHAAEAIEQVYADTIDAYLVELANHYRLAGVAANPAKLVEYASRAGDRALSAHAYAESTRLFGEAVAALTAKGPDASARDLLVDLHRKSAWAYQRLTRFLQARQHLEAALALMRDEPSAERCALLIELAHVCRHLVASVDVSPPGGHAPPVDIGAGRRYANEARALADRLGRDDLRAAALGALAGIEFYDGDISDSLANHGLALQRLRDGARSSTIATERSYAHLLYLSGRYADSIEHGQRAVALVRELGDMAALTHALGPLGLALAATGRYQEAEQVFADALQTGSQYGIDRYRARAISMSTALHLDLFDFDGALRRSEEATELARSVGVQTALVSAALDAASIDLRRGDCGRAIELLPWIREQHSAYIDAHGTALHGWLWSVRLAELEAEVALAQRDWRETIRLATASIDTSRARMRPKYECAGLAVRAQALAALDRKHEAISDLTTAVEVARRTADPALFVRTAATMLLIDSSAWLVAEAQEAVDRIMNGLRDPHLRRCVAESEPVRLIVQQA
jgi:tetratricopeptide (TPR) repeat protein